MSNRIPSHYQRAQIANFLNPDNGVRGKMERQGKIPKNHMRENLKEIREIEARVREVKEEETRQPKELYKLSQFRDANPRVFDSERRDSLPTQTEFLSRGTSEKRRDELTVQRRQARAELDAKMDEARYFAGSSGSTTPRKASVPKLDEEVPIAPRSNKDFIQRNKSEAFQSSSGGGGSSRNVREEETRHSEFGRVPSYLRERQNQWEEEKEEIRRRAPDPNCPPGMKLMPEDERLNTLDVLQQSREEAVRQLNHLPFVIETPSQKRRKTELEAKLKEIEGALALFTKPKVYIKL